MYDPEIKYTPTYLREFTPGKLYALFEEAKVVSHQVCGFELIKKVTKDVSNMRLLLNGFDSIYNKAHE